MIPSPTYQCLFIQLELSINGVAGLRTETSLIVWKRRTHSSKIKKYTKINKTHLTRVYKVGRLVFVAFFSLVFHSFIINAR